MFDLSHPIEAGMQTFPGDPEVTLTQAATHEADGYRVTEVGCGSHTGTHVDAPSHTEADGRTLDEFPIDRFVGEAVLVDCHDIPSRSPIPPARVPDTDADWIIIQTGWDDHWGTDRYLDHPYLAPETASRCGRLGYDVGLDTLNPDPTPSPRASADEPSGVPAHHELLGADSLIVENLTGLGELPDSVEFRLFALPIGGDGAPVRAVAVPKTDSSR